MAGNSWLQKTQRKHWQLKGDVARMKPNVDRLLHTGLLTTTEADIMHELISRAEDRREAQWQSAKFIAKELSDDRT